MQAEEREENVSTLFITLHKFVFSFFLVSFFGRDKTIVKSLTVPSIKTCEVSQWQSKQLGCVPLRANRATSLLSKTEESGTERAPSTGQSSTPPPPKPSPPFPGRLRSRRSHFTHSLSCAHSAVMTSTLRNLGALYRRQGKLEAAETLEEAATVGPKQVCLGLLSFRATLELHWWRTACLYCCTAGWDSTHKWYSTFDKWYVASNWHDKII